MKKLLFFLWISLTLIACQPSGNRDEQAIRTMCLEMVERYPEATLQDIYKTCFQDFFGAEHLLKDTAATQAVHDYFGHGERILYINIANNLSVDCDCSSHPADPEMNDIGILASLDPVALDQACVDLVFNYPSTDGDDAATLIERINTRHGIHILEHAAKIGLGSREYRLVELDPQ